MIDLKDVINNFDMKHNVERIILIGEDDSIRQIILKNEEKENQ